MKRLVFTLSVAGVFVLVGAMSAFAHGMTRAQASAIFQGCQQGASQVASAVRQGSGSCGGHPCVKEWCAVVNRDGTLLLVKSTDTGGTPQNPRGSDAWRGSIEIAIAKAYTAVAFSSSQQGLTTKVAGLLTRQDGPGSTNSTDIGTDAGVASLWGLGNTNPYRGGDNVGVNHHGIVTFGGGIPVYECGSDTLLGAVGNSGDGVDQDQDVSSLAIQDAGMCCQPNESGGSTGCPAQINP